MSQQNPTKKFDVQNLIYYFDGVTQDSIDSHAYARKNNEILKLRDRLLMLSDEQFEAAIKAIEKIVTPEPQKENSVVTATRRQSGADLYEKARDQGVTIHRTERVQRVS